MPEYDTTAYIHDEPRTYDQDADNCETCTDRYGDVCARVTWTPRGGSPVTVTGPYLDGNRQTGEIVLSCGVEALLSDLGIWDALEGQDEKRWTICDLVNVQLARRPWAEVKCREGTARLELLHVR